MIRLSSLAARRLAAQAALAALLVGAGLVQNELRHVSTGAVALVPAPPVMIGLTIDPAVVRRLLGVRLLVADLIWVDTLIKADHSHEGQLSGFYQAFKKMMLLDPDNMYAYYVGGLYLSVVKDDVRGATLLLRDGVKQLEKSQYAETFGWLLPMTLGYNLLVEENEIDEGSQWILKAAAAPGAPAHVKSLASKVATERGRLEIGSRVLNDLYRRVSKPEEKARVEAKMMDLTVRQELVELNEKFQAFLKSTGAYALPKKRQLQLFMRSTGHPMHDVLGRPLILNSMGRIGVAGKDQ